MKEPGITVLTDASLITCIVQRGTADKIVRAAQDAGAQGATINYAQGVGVRERLGDLPPRVVPHPMLVPAPVEGP